MKFWKFYLLISLIYSSAIAQSTSVFDANYFNNDDTAPPLRVGKGFHINDVYRQTKNCFKQETIDSKKLVAQQEGKKTSIKLYYTKTNKDYNEFKNRGTSGKVTFLNLFALDSQKLEEYTKSSIEEDERLIFSAVIDFGNFEFLNEPILNEDAKSLIKQDKLKEFVNFYGTHYISGIRKGSSIIVTLKKNSTEEKQKHYQQTNLNTTGKIPYKGNGSLEVDNSDWINNELKNNKFSVSVEINGPALEQTSIQSQINVILNGNSEDKLNAITKIIEDATKNITNPNQSIITQYYYAPFSLYGLEGIYWDTKKQNDLIRLNETLIGLHNDKILIDNILYGDNFFAIFNLEDNKQAEISKQKTISNLNSYKTEIDRFEKQIEQRYISCSDVYCLSSNSECCDVNMFISEIKSRNYEAKIEKNLSEFWNDIKNLIETERECYKKQQGVVKVENHSSNPYDLYMGQKYLGIINGKNTQTFYLNKGYYEFKAVQRSGYMLYPTENIRSAKIENVCQEITLKVGF